MTKLCDGEQSYHVMVSTFCTVLELGTFHQTPYIVLSVLWILAKSIICYVTNSGVTRMFHFVKSQSLPYSIEDMRQLTKTCKICAEHNHSSTYLLKLT